MMIIYTPLLFVLTKRGGQLFAAILFVFLYSLPGVLAAEYQWQKVPLRSPQQKSFGLQGGEGFQMTMSISFCKSNPEVVYFSSDTAQVWKSVDGGRNWSAMHAGFDAHGARSVFVDPVNPEIVFAAAFLGKTYKWAAQKHFAAQGIYKSSNGGKAWEKKYHAGFYRQPETRGNIFAADSTSVEKGRTRILFAGTYQDGLLRSEDFGNSWSPVGLHGIPVNEVVEDPDEGGDLYLATESGLFAWRKGVFTSLGRELPDWPRSVAAGKGGLLYVALGKSGVFRSEDKGNTFVPLRKGLPAGVLFTDIAVSPVDPAIVYVKASQGFFHGPYFSHDKGQHWQAAESWNKGNVLPHEKLFWFSSPIAPHPTEPLKALMASNGKGMMLRTDDGGRNWEYSASGFTGGRMTDIAFIDEKRMLFGLFDHGVFLSEDGGESFVGLNKTYPSAKKTILACAAQNSTLVAVVSPDPQKTYIAVSDDRGEHWHFFNKLQALKSAFAAFHQNGQTVYAGFYRSNDKGRSWNELRYPVMGMFQGNNDYIYATEEVGPKKCQVVRSSDKGVTWEKRYPPLPFPQRLVTGMAISPDDPDYLYVAANWQGLWIHEGGRWEKRSVEHGIEKDSFGRNFVKLVAVDPTNPARVLLGKWSPGSGQGNGVFESNDGGRSFHNVTGNIGPELSVWGLKVSPYDGTVFVGTSRGTYQMNVNHSPEKVLGGQIAPQ